MKGIADVPFIYFVVGGKSYVIQPPFVEERFADTEFLCSPVILHL